MIRFLINAYIVVLIVDTILSYLPQFRFEAWARSIKKAADLTLAPVRKVLPQDLPFDFSPLVVIISLKLIQALW